MRVFFVGQFIEHSEHVIKVTAIRSNVIRRKDTSLDVLAVKTTDVLAMLSPVVPHRLGIQTSMKSSLGCDVAIFISARIEGAAQLRQAVVEEQKNVALMDIRVEANAEHVVIHQSRYAAAVPNPVLIIVPAAHT